ncbi:SlyX protein [Paucidesulfovibrio gracilis DSM 16080]|uniref:SlyX protein n=1 Tax=Paucidesulfovibrio gracilis DSM 16080 TaxID=1121449 RepID=A0A1T4X805_9BACT|nr:SlyX family protein [Paucidesulfovibrio gracilis]SKA85754.1 SlyX protein [Paucidesulfovibrio gracilis DSM 16080]
MPQQDTSNLETRVMRLEESLALRDREVEQLNAALTEQQREINELRKQLDLLAGRYRSLREALQQDEEGPEPLPPHYLPK